MFVERMLSELRCRMSQVFQTFQMFQMFQMFEPVTFKR